MVKTTDTWTYETITAMNIKIFRTLGIMPLKDRTLSYIGTRFLLIYFLIINLLYGSMFFSYGITMFAQRNFDYFCELMTGQSWVLRYLMIFLKRQDYRKLMQSCKELWPNLTLEESRIMKTFERKLNYYRSFFVVNSLIAVTLYLITAKIVKLPPATVNGTERKVLPLGFYVDVQEEPAFTIVLLFQGFVCYNMVPILAGTETGGLFFIFMACGYLRSVQNRLLKMSDASKGKISNGVVAVYTNQEDKLSIQDVLSCAKFHQEIMKFCEEIELFLRGIYMIAIMCSAYSMSLVGIKLLENDEYLFNYVSILVMNLLQLLVAQWGPEVLLNESKEIANAAYFASLMHSQYERKANRILLIIVMRAQKPIQLTAGGYINLSMETFGQMIKNAFSFFTVLRSFNA